MLSGKKSGMSTALSGHLKMSDLDELARINPDIVGVRGAVCQKGDRDSAVHRGRGVGVHPPASYARDRPDKRPRGAHYGGNGAGANGSNGRGRLDDN